MINMNREITPDDFAFDTNRIFWVDDTGGSKARREYERGLEELRRLYEVQEEAKAKAHFKREQARKDLIPYSEALAIEICKRISEGQFVINICKDDEMPTVRLVNQWLKQYLDFKQLHMEAVNDRLNILEDELITIADESENDFKTITKGGKKVKVLDGEVISRAKLRVDVRRAHLKAYRPERWAEQSTLTVNNNDQFDPDNMTSEELERKIAELDDKKAAVKEPPAKAA